jgi:hypothetical protein
MPLWRDPLQSYASNYRQNLDASKREGISRCFGWFNYANSGE